MRKRSQPDDDAPELGPEFFKQAKWGPDAAPPGLLEAVRRERRRRSRERGKQKAPTKQLVSLRLSRGVLDAYRRTGRGWQGRINADLEKAAKKVRAER